MKAEDEYIKGKSAGEVETFLDRCLDEFGEKSVLNVSYVSLT